MSTLVAGPGDHMIAARSERRLLLLGREGGGEQKEQGEQKLSQSHGLRSTGSISVDTKKKAARLTSAAETGNPSTFTPANA